jgi:predicted permease
MRDWRSLVEKSVRSAGMRPEVESEIVDELTDHLSDRYNDLIARGMDANAAALQIERELGQEGHFAAHIRAERGRMYTAPVAIGRQSGRFLSGVVNDMRIGVRLLTRNAIFSVAAIATIALAIGANTALYSSLRSILLRPLPYPDPSSLVLIQTVTPRADEARTDTLAAWSYPKFEQLRAMQRTFTSLAGYATQEVTVEEKGAADRLTIELAHSAYFDLLGVRAGAGRLYNSDDEARPGAGAVIVLSDETWRARYGADPSVIGRTISVNRTPFVVIGIAAANFKGLDGSAAAWVPMSMAPVLLYPEALTERGNHWLDVIGRMSRQNSSGDVSRPLQQVFARIQADNGGNAAGRIITVPLDARRASPVMRRTLTVLFGAAMLTLLIACANIASLLVARGTARQQELSVRLALGAGKWRVMRQLVAESMVLAMIGGAAGAALGVAGSGLVERITPALAGDSVKGLLAVEPARFDAGVVAFTLVAILFTGLITGIAPALRATRADLSGALRDGSRAAGYSRSTVRTRATLVVVEAMLAVMLLVGAGLLLRTFAHYRAIDTGVSPDHVLTWRVMIPDNDARKPDQLGALYSDIAARVRALPGVAAVTTDRCLPLSAACPSTVATAAGERTFALDVAPPVDLHFVMPQHLDALRIPLKQGRMFNDADRIGAPRVVLLSESAARSLFGSTNPIGKTIKLATAFLRDDATAEVVGVVGDARYGEITALPSPAVYGPALQFATRSMYMMARTKGDPVLLAPLVRRAVRDAAPGVPVMRTLTLEEHLADVLARTRLLAMLLTAFAIFAFALAIIGVFGVIAWSVEQRRSEIGIRIALGASPSHVANAVAGTGFAWFALGVGLGVPCAVAATRVLRGLLYDIAPTDGLTYGIAITTILITGAVASYVPARAAARIDPATAMRTE